MFYPSPQEDKKIWVIELFSGCCRLSRAFAQHGYRALAYDIEYGSGCDLLDPLVIASLLRFVRSHTVKLVWMAMPCQSWSLARKGDGGPPPLRDDHLFLRGCPHLSDADQSKVSIGNSMLELTFSLAQHFTANDIDWVIENPWTSRCWLTQEFVALARAGARLLPVDYCQFNVPWRKSTGLLTSGFRTLDQCLKLCTPHCGRCSASGKRHLALINRILAPCVQQLQVPWPAHTVLVGWGVHVQAQRRDMSGIMLLSVLLASTCVYSFAELVSFSSRTGTRARKAATVLA